MCKFYFPCFTYLFLFRAKIQQNNNSNNYFGLTIKSVVFYAIFLWYVFTTVQMHEK